MSCPYVNTDVFTPSVRVKNRQNPIPGTKIFIYYDTFIWTDDHVTPTELKTWRQHGDQVIDLFYRLNSDQLQDGQDVYEYIQTFLLPNPSSSITFAEFIRQKPSWFDPVLAENGQKFLLKNAPLVVASVFHFTLLLGYGFQQLNDVLNKTQYLASNDLHHSYLRLVETLQMVTKAVSGDINDFDQTFSDVVRVRLLHGMVRYHIEKCKTTSTDDISINQEDLLVTLLGFSYSVLHCIEDRMKIKLSDNEKYSYLHLWRYIGWLSGIEEKYLYYLSSYRLAQVMSQSIFYHLYSPTLVSKHMIHHALMASYMYGPLSFSFQTVLGVTQLMFGKDLSEALDVNKPHLDHLHVYLIKLLFFTFSMVHRLGTLKIEWLDRWLIKKHKKQLWNQIHTDLGYKLKNFSIYRNQLKIPNITGAVSLKDCSCQYYQRKNNQKIKNFDISIFRCKQQITLATFFTTPFLLLIIISSCFCAFLLI